ncbi:hypothetical protein [Stenotrophomonas rhizophila]|uniref:hypothetical protein n=1 Tax=Stenotrophomonas rhizophila TaxID=216778 RepID=UPI001E57255F|nr:hypothetical protein [Stenotrophomonas rhizophila]MCC7632927.1 hypothetical protein [Stenotrophomonas rhizophila]MCC7662348.1 hypothetical protein [Stenotrophomonas rhizophila]
MLIKVQCQDRHWHVVHPAQPDPVAFLDGALAFDFADRLARDHHDRTGAASAVRVEAYDAHVDAVRYG